MPGQSPRRAELDAGARPAVGQRRPGRRRSRSGVLGEPGGLEVVDALAGSTSSSSRLSVAEADERRRRRAAVTTIAPTMPDAGSLVPARLLAHADHSHRCRSALPPSAATREPADCGRCTRDYRPQMRHTVSVTTYRVAEAAELLGVSDDTVRRWVDAGRCRPRTGPSRPDRDRRRRTWPRSPSTLADQPDRDRTRARRRSAPATGCAASSPGSSRTP